MTVTLLTGKPFYYEFNHLCQLSLPSLPGRWFNRAPACLASVRPGAFTCIGWQVALCRPIWQATLRSSEMTCSGELHCLTTVSLTVPRDGHDGQRGVVMWRTGDCFAARSEARFSVGRPTVNNRWCIENTLFSADDDVFRRTQLCRNDYWDAPLASVTLHKLSSSTSSSSSSSLNSQKVRLVRVTSKVTRNLCYRKDDRAMRPILYVWVLLISLHRVKLNKVFPTPKFPMFPWE